MSKYQHTVGVHYHLPAKCNIVKYLSLSRSPILKSLARHRKSLFGRGFYGELDGGNIRTAMYLEVIMKTCLYFIRSYYHLEQMNINQKDIEGNKQVIFIYLVTIYNLS